MPSSYFPGPALPAADQIMWFPGEELGSTMCGGWISQELLLVILSHMLYLSGKDWTWEVDETRKDGWSCRKLFHSVVMEGGSGETFLLSYCKVF